MLLSLGAAESLWAPPMGPQPHCSRRLRKKARTLKGLCLCPPCKRPLWGLACATTEKAEDEPWEVPSSTPQNKKNAARQAGKPPQRSGIPDTAHCTMSRPAAHGCICGHDQSLGQLRAVWPDPSYMGRGATKRAPPKFLSTYVHPWASGTPGPAQQVACHMQRLSSAARPIDARLMRRKQLWPSGQLSGLVTSKVSATSYLQHVRTDQPCSVLGCSCAGYRQSVLQRFSLCRLLWRPLHTAAGPQVGNARQR